MKTKVYILLAALGLAALAIDKCHFAATAPESIEAGEFDDVASDSEPTKPSPTPGRSRVGIESAAGPQGVPQLHFPRDLPDFDPQRNLRDLFAPAQPAANPNAGLGGSTSPGRKAADGPKDAIGREAFSARHRIEGIMVQERLKIAVINGRWLRVGDILDGCTLTRIEGDFAVFQCYDGDAPLSPARPQKDAPD